MVDFLGLTGNFWGEGIYFLILLMENQLLAQFLPCGILDYFDIEYYCTFCYLKTKEEGFLIHLAEKNILPDGYSSSEYESKGFLAAVQIQDFPIRGKLLYLNIRKRRWRKKSDKNQTICRDYKFLADGTHMTADLSAFLKDTGRDPRRYNVEYL